MACIRTIIVAALLLLPGAALAEWTAQKSARVDALVQQFLTQRPGAAAGPALSIAIGVDGQIVLAKGFGQARQDVPASARTVYHIGSLTKQFTAAAVLRLIETGARAPLSANPLALDTQMGEIFEGVERWTAPDEPPITVRSAPDDDVEPAELHVATTAERRPLGRRRHTASARGAQGAPAARLAEHVRIQQHRLLPAGERPRSRARRRGTQRELSRLRARRDRSSARPIANGFRRRLRRRIGSCPGALPPSSGICAAALARWLR